VESGIARYQLISNSDGGLWQISARIARHIEGDNRSGWQRPDRTRADSPAERHGISITGAGRGQKKGKKDGST
jgi:hypothetical protein